MVMGSLKQEAEVVVIGAGPGGYAAAIRIDSLAILPAMNFSAALATFVGQNIGAGRSDRVRAIEAPSMQRTSESFSPSVLRSSA